MKFKTFGWASLFVLLVIAGCDQGGVSHEGASEDTVPAAASKVIDLPAWRSITNIGPEINTMGPEFSPETSNDGLTLYFASLSPGGLGGIDIWVSQRSSKNDPWGTPVNIGAPVNSEAEDNAPTLSEDEHWLFIMSSRPGGFGGTDLWAFYRDDINDDFGWHSPMNLGPSVNTSFAEELGSFLGKRGRGKQGLFFTSNRPGGAGGFDIYFSEVKPDGRFAPAQMIEELSGPADDRGPQVSKNGREMYLGSTREGGLGNIDIWVTTRNNPWSAWSEPVNVGAPVNTAFLDGTPHLTYDGTQLIITSFRPEGNVGFLDLFVASRTPRVGLE